jgi:exonuclease SbcC
VRPRRVTVTAFGPFAGTIDLDFSQLDAAGVFLVSGPTGAGKTSILDAITYALYGEVGGGRLRDRLRSDHADPRVDTAVAFEFALRGEDWRVTRSPRHERARRRGPGTTVQSPTATLARRAGGRWQPEASGVQEVGMALDDLLGLDRQQFQQVVVLPQGQVQEALRASASDRERLLSSLFDADRFEAYTGRLTARARELEAEAGRQADALAALRRQAADRQAELVDTDAGPPQTQADLETLRTMAAEAAADAAATVADAAAEAEAAEAALLAAELVADRCRRRAAAERTLAEQAALDPEIDELRARLQRGELAVRCAPLLTQLDEAGAALAEAAAAREAAEAPAHRAAERLPAAMAVTADPAALDRLQRLVATAERLAADARDAEAAAAEAVARRADAERLRAGADALDAEARRLDDEIAAAAIERDEARNAAAQLDRLAAAAAQTAGAAGAAAELPALEDAYDAALAADRAAAEAHSAALRAHADLLQRRIDGMAAELAAALAEGEACTVCGSTEHPSPAPCVGTVDQADVDAAEATAAALRDEADAAQAARLAAADALADVRARAGADPAGAAARADAAAAELADAEARTAGLDAALALLDELDAAADRAREAAADQRVRAAAADSAAEGAQARAEDVIARVSAELGDGVSAATVAADLGVLVDRLGALRDAQHAERAAIVAAEDAARRLRALLDEIGMASVDEVRHALVGRRSWPEWRERVDRHARTRAAALAALEDPALAGLPASAPDVDETRARSEQARKARDAAVARDSVVRRIAADLAGLARRHAAGLEALEPVRADADRVRRLAALCDGSGNAARMSLKRYVLAAYLEEITDAASVRLQAMTDGRYALRHSDERARHGAASGLGVVAADAWTGATRDVGTLSGGETFQAALAFALGVADVVQRHTGGMHLDTLFVDEGFGALDPEALEQAMAELDRLREGGRLVGVISHVAALRERIPAGIRVTRSPTGSTARVEVGDDL